MHSLRRLILLTAVIFAVCMVPQQSFAQRAIATLFDDDNGVQLTAVAVNSTTNQIYFADPSSNTVSVFDGANNQALAIVQVGEDPVALAVDPMTNKTYVADAGDNTLAIIDGNTFQATTVPVGAGPVALAVNPTTNVIYVANSNDDTVTVVNGATLATTTLAVGVLPVTIAVNPVTNKIYVGNQYWIGNSSITVIDGATNHLTTVTLPGSAAFWADLNGNSGLAINPITNKIYAAGAVNVLYELDGATNVLTAIAVYDINNCSAGIAVNSATNIVYIPMSCRGGVVAIYVADFYNSSLIPTGKNPASMAVDSTRNKIYVVNQDDGTLSTIDGTANSTVTIQPTDPFLPSLYATPVLGLNPVTNLVYVADQYNANDQFLPISVVAGASPLEFVPLQNPCRLVDTRPANGGLGPIRGGTYQEFNLTRLGDCGIPTTAAAYSLNLAVVPEGPLGYLTIWPYGQAQPLVATMNSDGRIKANAAIVAAGNFGVVDVYVTNTTNLVIDINGYFQPAGSSTLAYYPLPPCRLFDTRDSQTGGPFLQGRQERDFNLLQSFNECIPQGVTPSAYSLNVTAVPHQSGQPLSYLTVWPTGQPMPQTSTLNNPTGTIVANAVITRAAANGDLAVYPTNDTDLVIDINGYFALPGTGGLSLYTQAPCRVLDTRQNGDPPFYGKLTVSVGALCPQASTAQSFLFNATVVPKGSLGFLTLWADRQPQPDVATLNATDGAITSNLAIVPTTNGRIDAYAYGKTQLILDIFGYFAP